MGDETAAGGDSRALGAPVAPASADPRSVTDLCPFLSSADGDWRSIVAIREHRCTAVDPVAVLSLDKQRRLCLAREHVTCSTYLAARQRLLEEEEPVGEPAGEGSEPPRPAPARQVLRWATPMAAPVVLDRGRPSLRDVLVRRSTTQLALVLLMALAFLVLALARLSAGGTVARPAPSAGVHATLSPSLTLPAVVASAMVSSSPVGSPTAARPSPSASSTAAASAAASPSVARTYRVVAGDTLTGIAARFGVTLRALEAANGISDPSRLRIGTVLAIP